MTSDDELDPKNNSLKLANIPRASQILSMDDFLPEGRISQSQRVAKRASLLTTGIHDKAHILDKTIDDLKNLQCGDPTLVQGESVQPFQHHLIEISSKMLLYKRPCVALSQIKWR